MGAHKTMFVLGPWLGVCVQLGCARPGGSPAPGGVLEAPGVVSVLNTGADAEGRRAANPTTNEQPTDAALVQLTLQDAGANDADSGAPISCESVRLPGMCTEELFTLERCHGLETVLLDPDAAARIVQCLAKYNRHFNPCDGEAFGMCAVETRRESPGSKDPKVIRACKTAQHICQRSPSGSVDFSQCSDIVGQLRPEFRSVMLQCLRRTCNRYSCFEDVLRKRFPKFP